MDAPPLRQWPDGDKRHEAEPEQHPDRHTDARRNPTEAILAAVAREDVAGTIVRVRYRVGEEQVGTVDQGAVREALADAEMVAAIERVVDAQERRQRTVVRQDTTLKDAMSRYVAQHEKLANMEDELVAAALEIEQEIEG